ncbi:uncharacterized protein Z519_00683 [Cladophialophora bantiana CBS 173.52]|uniref:Major facilitator superfamily (MFS) profile domain-containing protein n=1 Tax=Cladophialophora bantiana (strain ATCC 10958 / CBS 173.52 / CDC B-1940 / NIH 8579) TaxID=1442370 RepID=A0A0D2I6Y1_CLAB1|nr:uncharacterized protein Z519_00683 [Cladophialophora bantiana CBS 173.52]KIW99020.1 hypothetical protein Z519_00683 [Cladophialophora bantiana CBS 173.52]
MQRGAVKSKDKLNWYTIRLLAFIGLGSLTFGYPAAVIGTLLGQPSFLEYFDLETRSNGTDLISTMNGIFQTGGFIGTLLLPWVADKWGRRWALAVPAILVLVSGAVMAGSTNVGEFIVFRFFAGAGSWMSVAAAPLMMSELVPVNLRGGLVEIHGIFFQIGYMSSGWIGFGTFFWPNNGNNWRLPVALQCLSPLLLLCGLPFCPESPRWLVMQNRDEEAKRVLEKVHSHSDEGHDRAHAELYQIQKQVAIDRELKCTWTQLFRKPSYRKRAILAIGTTGIVQFAGVLVINNYGPVIYKLLGYGPEKQLLFPVVWLTVGFCLFLVAPGLIDLFPRNILLGGGIIGCSVMLMIISALIANFVPSNNTAALKATVACFYLYQPFYVIGLDGTQFTFLGEIFPTHLRAKGVCLGSAVIALMNIIWLQSAPTALANIGWKYFLVFIIGGVIGGVLILIFWPDTRNMPLEEVAAIFGDEDEVAVYQFELEIDPTTHTVRDHHLEGKVLQAQQVEGERKDGQVEVLPETRTD